MPALELGGMTLGLREGVIFLIALVALYMLIVILRMRRLRRAPEIAAEKAAPVATAGPAQMATDAGETWARASEGMAGDALRRGLEQEIDQLRDEVDSIRGELAALRGDMKQELAYLRASQTVSPIYGDAMQMAASGYEPAATAERCGIARAEAELVVALAKSQES